MEKIDGGNPRGFPFATLELSYMWALLLLERHNASQQQHGTSYKKYRNAKVMCDGILLDSLWEYAVYIFLLSRQHIGEIKNLRVHVPFELIPEFSAVSWGYEPRRLFKPDFCWYNISDNSFSVAEAKSIITAQRPDYVLRRTFFIYQNPSINYLEYVMIKYTKKSGLQWYCNNTSGKKTPRRLQK